MEQGIYFRAATNELVSVRTPHDTLPGGDWERVAVDPALGLVAARRAIVERGLRDDEQARAVFWHMGATAQATAGRAAGDLNPPPPSGSACELTERSKDAALPGGSVRIPQR